MSGATDRDPTSLAEAVAARLRARGRADDRTAAGGSRAPWRPPAGTWRRGGLSGGRGGERHTPAASIAPRGPRDLGVVQHIHLGHGATAYHLVAETRRTPLRSAGSAGASSDLPVGLLDGSPATVAGRTPSGSNPPIPPCPGPAPGARNEFVTANARSPARRRDPRPGRARRGRSGRDDTATSTTTFAVAAPGRPASPGGVCPPHRRDALTDVDLVRSADGFWRARVAGLGRERITAIGSGARAGISTRHGSGAGPAPASSPIAGRAGSVQSQQGPHRSVCPRDLARPSSPDVAAAGADAGVFGWGPRDYRENRSRVGHRTLYAPRRSSSPTPRRPAQTRHRRESSAIYEAHVRNLTLRPSASRCIRTSRPARIRRRHRRPRPPPGTYAGAGHLAAYVKALGFSAIEPCRSRSRADRNSPRPVRSNHWAYMTLGFFAPNRQYAADQSPAADPRVQRRWCGPSTTRAWRSISTSSTTTPARGGNWGDADTVGFTGFGGFATTDYVLTDDGQLVDGATGCTATRPICRARSPSGTSSSRSPTGATRWVDGFRFDLAPVLGRAAGAGAGGLGGQGRATVTTRSDR